jgi:signal transduction histidine kinase
MQPTGTAEATGAARLTAVACGSVITGIERLRQLLTAVMSLGAEVDLASTLQRIVTTATELTGATYGAFGVLSADGESLSDFITAGIDQSTHRAIGALPTGRGVLGVLIAEPTPLRLSDLGTHPASIGMPPGHPVMTSFLGVPVQVHDKPHGILYLCDKEGHGEFDEVDEETTVTLAAAAGVAIENSLIHDRFADLLVLEDRERIARELHDVVIQRLYGVGLNLQGSVRLSDDEQLTERLETAIDDLDQTIRDIRSTIFELHINRSSEGSLRQALLEVIAECGRVLGFDPTVRFEGPLDAAVGDKAAAHLLVVVREALSNIARHANATEATLTISVNDDLVALTVSDNGIGPPLAEGEQPPTGGNGLHNIRVRAEQLAGESSLTRGATGGALLRWIVPVDRTW